jgi:hypothetical protein
LDREKISINDERSLSCDGSDDEHRLSRFSASNTVPTSRDLEVCRPRGGAGNARRAAAAAKGHDRVICRDGGLTFGAVPHCQSGGRNVARPSHDSNFDDTRAILGNAFATPALIVGAIDIPEHAAANRRIQGLT